MTVRVRLLGPLELVFDSEVVANDRKPLLVLAALALADDRRLHQDDLARLVWPRSSRELARLSLRQARYQIAEWCEAPCVRLVKDLLMLADGVTVDLWEYEAAAAAGDHEEVLRRFSGDVLARMVRQTEGQLARDIESRSARVRKSLRLAYQEVVRERLDAGRNSEAILAARTIADLEPLDEAVQEQLVRTHLAVGDHVGARNAFDDYEYRLLTIHDEPPDWMRELVGSEHEPVRPMPRAAPTSSPDLEPRGAPVRWLGLAMVAAVLLMWSAWPTAQEWPQGSHLAIPIDTRDGRGQLWVDFRDGTRTIVPRNPVPANSTPLPGTSTYAHGLEVPSGYDLVVVHGDSMQLVKSERADELPLAWGPRGDRLLYRSGRFVDDYYETGVRWIDIATGEERSLQTYRTNPSILAAWAPDGTTVAMVVRMPRDGRESLVLMTADGSIVGEVSVAQAGPPNWSPTGERVAFLDRAAGQTAVVSVDRDGQNRRRHVTVPADLSTPVWLTDDIILFVADFGRGGDVWAFDERDDQLARITDREDIAAIRGDAIDRRSIGWLSRVSQESWSTEQQSIDDLGRFVTEISLAVDRPPVPGEFFQVTASATWEDGRVTTLRPETLRWSPGPGTNLTAVPGVFRLGSSESVSLSADLRGWRQAHLSIEPSRLSEYDAEVILSETWQQNPTTHDWLLFGEPQPTIDRSLGRFRGNGDQNYLSGAVSRSKVSTARGLTLEVEGYVPLNGGIYQDFVIGLVQAPPEASASPTFPHPADLVVMVEQDGISTRAAGRSLAPVVPPAAPLPDFATYAVQVESDGLFTVLLNGAVHVRGQLPVLPDSTHILLGANSIGTDIVHGRVSLYSGPKYHRPRD